LTLGLIGEPQVLGHEEIRQPQCGSGIYRRGCKVATVERKPGRAEPAPSITNRRSPRIVGPPIKPGMVIVGRHVTVVRHAAVVIRAIYPRVGVPTLPVGALNV